MEIEKPLVTWGEIASALNESADAVRRKYRQSLKSEDPMPIIKNGRVKMYYSRYKEWLCRQPGPFN